jgi:hypothetical protein
MRPVTGTIASGEIAVALICACAVPICWPSCGTSEEVYPCGT